MNAPASDLFHLTRLDLVLLTFAGLSVVALLLVAMTAAGEDWQARVAGWFTRDVLMPWPDMDHEGPIHGLRADQLVDDGPDLERVDVPLDDGATQCEALNPLGDGERCLLVAGHEGDHVSSHLLAWAYRRPVFVDPVDPIKGQDLVHEITRGPDGRLAFRIIEGGKGNG